MATVIWTTEALEGVHAIRSYIAQFNPSAADQISDGLLMLGESLTHFPARGREIGGGRRQITAVWPYILRYRINGDQVFILVVRHGARRPE